MPQSSDIHLRQIDLSWEKHPYRMPIKFGLTLVGKSAHSGTSPFGAVLGNILWVKGVADDHKCVPHASCVFIGGQSLVRKTGAFARWALASLAFSAAGFAADVESRVEARRPPRYLPTAELVANADPSVANMVFPDRDWEEATPESHQIDSDALARAVNYLKSNSGHDSVREIVILRRGRLIWKGDNIDKVHGVWSCTKTFTGTVLGLLIQDGKCTLESRAGEFVPELREHFPEVRLRHFATMTSGYRAVGDEPIRDYAHGPSRTPFEPSPLPLFSPGTHYAYWDSAMNTFALVLTRIAGEPLEAFFKRRIADPIGMDPEGWEWNDWTLSDGTVVNGGAGNNSKYIQISARQMARFGHLFLNHGQWNGGQLVSPQWVAAATSAQVPRTLPLGHEIDGRGIYGFNWWTNEVGADGKRRWPDAPADMFVATGWNNNRLYVIPKWQMVVVRLGLDQRDLRISDEVWSRFLGMIGEAQRGNDAAFNNSRSP
jgi:CubicO group peptidase (beta-lactamase class C family)